MAPAPAATWRAELRALFVLAWPLVLAQLAQHALWTTDLIVMGMLGAQYVAAGALANAFFFALQLTAIGIVGAVAPLVSQALGARDIKAVRKIAQAGLWIGLACAAVMVPIVWQAEAVLLALGQNAGERKARRDLPPLRRVAGLPRLRHHRHPLVPRRPRRDPGDPPDHASPASSSTRSATTRWSSATGASHGSSSRAPASPRRSSTS